MSLWENIYVKEYADANFSKPPSDKNAFGCMAPI